MAPAKPAKPPKPVDDRRTGEVLEAHLGKPAAAPLPVAADRIDQAGEDRAVDQVARDLHAAGNGARDDRRGGRGEDRLEQPVNLGAK